VYKSTRARKNLLVLIIIASVASSISIVSLQYSIQTSDEIRKSASEDISNNARDEVYDLSRIVINRMDSVTTNLEVLASAPTIQTGKSEGIEQLLDAAQYSTEDLTEYYMWLDSNGKLVSASNIARASYHYNALWQSEIPPFVTQPEKTASIYYSGIIHSPTDNADRLYISYPIVYSLQQDTQSIGDFTGVIVAVIRLDTLGRILTNELSPTFKSDVSLADISGKMIYSVDKTVIGKNLFEDPVYLTAPILTELSQSTETEIAQFLKSANSDQETELVNISVGGKSFTIASHPVVQKGYHFWTIYITAPHIFTDNVDALLAKQDTFTMATFVIVGAVSIGLAYLILSWNNRLEATVKTRTLELYNSNILLLNSNAQLEKANEQLQVHANLQREFVNIAAHELRTPIMPILAMSDLLEAKLNQSRNGEILLSKNDFDIISRNSRRLERLATDILDVTRIETHTLHLNKEKFNLHDLVEFTITDMKNQFSNSKVVYIIEMDRGMEIHADRSKIAQVLSNVLNNAAKFTDEGTITVSGRLEDAGSGNHNIHISISDTGIGIAPEIASRLFTKFASNSRIDRPQIGSGLGLYISRGIIEAHNGKMWVESKSVGKGTIVHQILPMQNRTIQSASI